MVMVNNLNSGAVDEVDDHAVEARRTIAFVYPRFDHLLAALHAVPRLTHAASLCLAKFVASPLKSLCYIVVPRGNASPSDAML